MTRKFVINFDYVVIRIKTALLKLRYPKADFYTRIVLANNFSMNEIDEWVRDHFRGIEPTTIHEVREEICYEEVSYWD